MKRPLTVRLFISMPLCCVVLSICCSAQAIANKQAVLGQARRSYYNLRDEGLKSFQCSITPNWELLLRKEREQNPEGVATAIETLGRLQFTVDLSPDGTVKLTHNELTGQSAEMMATLKQLYGGIAQMTSGFFDTWKLFMLSPPFPEIGSEYQLQAKGPQYLLTYRDGTTDVVTTMGRDFGISNTKTTTAELDRVIQPSFIKTDKGFLLSGYQETYPSQKPDETELRVHIDYQLVEGMQMPHKLNVSGTNGGAPFAVELAFSDCTVTKKQ